MTWCMENLVRRVANVLVVMRPDPDAITRGFQVDCSAQAVLLEIEVRGYENGGIRRAEDSREWRSWQVAWSAGRGQFSDAHNMVIVAVSGHDQVRDLPSRIDGILQEGADVPGPEAVG